MQYRQQQQKKTETTQWKLMSVAQKRHNQKKKYQ